MPSRVTVVASALAVLGGIVLTLAIYRQMDLRAAPPIVIQDPLVDVEIIVAVDGAVASPGVVAVAAGARWGDAIAAAGGALPSADMTTVNQAQRLVDGDRVIIPARAPVGMVGTVRVGAEDRPAPDATEDAVAVVPTAPAGARPTATPGTAVVAIGDRLDVNVATAAELEALPEIGSVLAGRIVEHRERVGRFASVDDLAQVEGISVRIIEVLRPLVTV